MKKIAMYLSILLVGLTTICCGKHEFGRRENSKNGEQITVPGVVIAHYKRSSRMYPSSPSICILPNGEYLISVEQGGPACPTPKVTDIFKSSDKGQTWLKFSSITQGQAWSNLFVYNDDVYIMGVDGPLKNCVLRKSTDNGATWTAAVSADNGLLMSGEYHTAPTPFVVHNNRVWRAMECVNKTFPAWPKNFNAMMMSAPVGQDIMKAASWSVSNQMPFDQTYLDGYFGGWLEGNAVVGKDGSMKLVMRVEVPQSNEEKIAILSVSSDGSQLTFDPNKDFVSMPGGAKKFTIRYDETSGRYWTLSNLVEEQYFHVSPGFVRNVLALCSSTDLRSWTAHKKILSYPEIKYHAFQYVDWHVDGSDIVFVSRTAYDDQFGGADTYHNANYTTFHKVINFRELSVETCVK